MAGAEEGIPRLHHVRAVAVERLRPPGSERQVARPGEVVAVARRTAHLPWPRGQPLVTHRACEMGKNGVNHAGPAVIIGRMVTTVRAR